MPMHSTLEYHVPSSSSSSSTATANKAAEHSQLRQRKQLPPLASPLQELTMDHPAADPLADDAERKAEREALQRNHLALARAFKLNDAAMLLPFLDKHVTLTTHDGHFFEGPSAVLGCLVGPKMSKLSGALHVKGRPTRTAPWQTAFVYEHGLVFKEPLYSEIVDWKPQSSIVTRITHTRLSDPNDGGPPKSVADVVKVVASLPHRLSLSDDDDNVSPPASRRSSIARANSHGPLAVGSPSSSDGLENAGAVVTRVAVTSKLTPIRKRKLVNAFLTVESEDGAMLWKSTVAKKQLLPVWSGIDLEIPPPVDEFSGMVVVTLWDYGLFRSLRVATTHITGAQLLKNERGGLASLELKPMGLSSLPVELSFSIMRLNNERDWRPRKMSIVSTVAAVDAAMADYDEDVVAASTAVVRKLGAGWLDLDPFAVEGSWLVVTSAIGVLLVCSALLWLHSSGQLVAK